ncbi:alpha/beta hydrolase [Streptomyces marincola]|uniref:alpha/beta hydrolase n=1 Tax=Streptomyces marincola TaxID=2878388 RepID=UPI001CF5152A|nr:alpha/beta hydrolase family protein [Streptomyces marincola]UCM91092.1 esterase family protein [Streptomyces marincola]
MQPTRSHARRLWCAALALALAAVSGPATGGALARADDHGAARGAVVVERERSGERTLDLTIESPALGTTVRTRVLLPPGHDRDPGRTWPAIYLLHGCCDASGGHDDWTDSTDVAAITARTEALIVMPEGGPVGYYSDWWNGGRGGPPAWETFHLTELPAVLAREVGAGDLRAVAGASMGGTGALAYAGRHPGFFRAAAAYSGRLDTRVDAPAVMARLEDFGHDPLALWGDPEAQADVWAAHDPSALVADLPPGYPVYVSSGNGEPGPLDPHDAPHDALEAQFGEMAAAYVAAARAHGLDVTASLGPGRHHYGYWEREFARSLPLLAEAVGARGGHTTATGPTSGGNGAVPWVAGRTERFPRTH